MTGRTADGRAFRILNIIDEYTRECLAIHVERRLAVEDVLDKLYELPVPGSARAYPLRQMRRKFSIRQPRWLMST